MSEESKLINKIKKWAILEIEACAMAIMEGNSLDSEDNLRRRMMSGWCALKIIDPNHELVKQKLHNYKIPQLIKN